MPRCAGKVISMSEILLLVLRKVGMALAEALIARAATELYQAYLRSRRTALAAA